MKTLVIGKARPIGSQEIPDVTISIAGETPECDTLQRQALLYDSEATMLESLLHLALPGGLYDRLVAIMLRRAASNLMVSRVRPVER